MDCIPSKKIAANCAICKKHDGTTHLVGTEFYCTRHCPVHELGPRLAIAGEPQPGVTEALDRELVFA